MSHTRTPVLLTTQSLIALSLLLKESTTNTFQTLSHSLLWEKSGFPHLVPEAPGTDADAMTGYPMPTRSYNAGFTAKWDATQAKAETTHLAFLLAYGMGLVTPTVPYAGVYLYDCQQQSGLTLPTASVGMRYSAEDGGPGAALFGGFAVNGFSLDLLGKEYVGCSGNLIGTGRIARDIMEELVTAHDNVTSLALASNGIKGSTAGLRLTNLHALMSNYGCTDPAMYGSDCAVSAVSDAEPGVITLTSLGGAGVNTSYRATYRSKTKDDLGNALTWTTFPAMSQLAWFTRGNVTLMVDGEWSGSAYVGGRSLGCDVTGLNLSWNNNAAPKFCPGGAGQGDYADEIRVTGNKELKLSMSRELTDMIFQFTSAKSRYTSLYYKVQQKDAIASSYYPYLEVIIPKLGMPDNPIADSNGLLMETPGMIGFSHATYGGPIIRLQCAIPTVMA